VAYFQWRLIAVRSVIMKAAVAEFDFGVVNCCQFRLRTTIYTRLLNYPQKWDHAWSALLLGILIWNQHSV